MRALWCTLRPVGSCARFVTTGAFELQGDIGWGRAAGWPGLPMCLAALYLGLALLLEDLQHQTVLPLFRREAARTSSSGLGMPRPPAAAGVELRVLLAEAPLRPVDRSLDPFLGS